MAQKNKLTPIYIGAGAIALLAAYKFGLFGKSYQGSDQNLSVPVKSQNLTHPRAFYQNLADLLYREFNKIGITFGSAIIKGLATLNKDELIQVVKDFGTRASTISAGGFTVAVGAKKNLFEWIESDLSEGNINKLHTIFKPTGLW